MTTTPTQTPERFSAVLRSRTTQDHRNAERSGFMGTLMQGTLPLDGYIDMLAQHWYLYEELEAQGAALRSDPVAGPFVDDALLRLPGLSADLQDLAGADWKAAFPASAPTVEYVAQVRRACAQWSGGFIAHHYTRYLGDLSGGQHIGAVAARCYGLGGGHAGRFATFEGIEDPAAYREAYREKLDAVPWTAEEQERAIAEIHEAYRLNTAVFADLDRHAS